MRYLTALLALLMLLAGCSGAPSETVPQTTTAPMPTDPGLYEPGSELETATGGAVHVYAVSEDAIGVLTMGSDLLVLTRNADSVTLDKLTGDNCRIAYTTQLPAGTSPSHIQVENNALAYYDAADNAVVFLDSMLRESGRTAFPEALTAPPALSADLKNAFYASGHEIRVLELSTGVSRLLRSQVEGAFLPVKTVASDSVLECSYADEPQRLEYISTENGRTVATSEYMTLSTWQEAYFAVVDDGNYTQWIFGASDTEPQGLYLPDTSCTAVPLLSTGCALGIALSDQGAHMDLYDLESGHRTAAVTLPGIAVIEQPVTSDEQKRLWFLASDATGGKLLCRWEPALSSVEDSTDYSDRRYTAAAPDEEGLKRCAKRAQELSERYGLTVKLWDAGVPEGYTFKKEYRVQAVMQLLDSVEPLLQRFPEGFLSELEDGELTLQLVASISAESDAAPICLAYWLDGKGNIALSQDDDLELHFYVALSHILDAHIYANSLAFDDWDRLNPAGFSYDGTYSLYASRQDGKWLSGQDRAFVDEYSKTFAREDRARIFAYSMLEDSEDVFASDGMQKKLRRICDAIRDAFDWEKSEGVFLWEQYLQ